MLSRQAELLLVTQRGSLAPQPELPPHISAGKHWLLLQVTLVSSVMAAALNCVLILQHLWLCLIFVSLILLHFRNAINKIFLKERKHGRDLNWKMSPNWSHPFSSDARGGEGPKGQTASIKDEDGSHVGEEQRQEQLSSLRWSCCPARGPCQLELAQGAFSGWERAQTDPAGLWERSQTAGRGSVPTGCVPAAAGTNLSQTVGQWCHVTPPAQCL